MAISKGERAAGAVIAGGQVAPRCREAHINSEETVIDRVGVLVDEDPGHRWSRAENLRLFLEQFVFGRVDHRQLVAANDNAAHLTVHREAADPRAFHTRNLVSRTAINPDRTPAIWAEQ